MEILNATTSDVPAVLAIYNDAVANTTAIWNDTPVDLQNREAWLRQREAEGNPVLVAKAENGRVLGYASYGPFRAWEGYRHTVEHSIYVAAGAQGQGVGRALLTDLIQRAQQAGKHTMIAGIESRNDPSLHLHRSMGFTEVGYLREVGTKFGQWLDLIFLQRILDDPSGEGG